VEVPAAVVARAAEAVPEAVEAANLPLHPQGRPSVSPSIFTSSQGKGCSDRTIDSPPEHPLHSLF
jgi:hypothetical protein